MIPDLQKPSMEFPAGKFVAATRTLTGDGAKCLPPVRRNLKIIFRDGQRFGVQIAYSFEGRIEDGRTDREPPWLGLGESKKLQTFRNF